MSHARALLTVTLLGAALARNAAAASENPEGSEQLRNIVIEGTPRLEMKGDKPMEMPKMDPKVAIEEYLAVQLTMPSPTSEFAPGRLAPGMPSYLPARLSSNITLTPWRRHLIRPPVMDLMIKRPGKLKVDRWRLVITDDRGKVFQTIKGTGELPEHLLWDGTGYGGDKLKVGHPYSYSFFILDRAQVPTYIPGKSVRLSGFIDESRGKTLITIDSGSLFSPGGLISELGQTYLREAQDAVRLSSSRSLEVLVYDEDKELAQKQAEAVRQQLIDALHLDEDKVEARGLPAGPSRYNRTEVATR